VHTAARRRLQVRLQILLLRAFGELAGRLPRRAALPITRLAGLAWYLASPGARAAVRANLRHVLRHDPSLRLVRRVFDYGALNYWDIFALPYLSRDQIVALVDIDGLDHLDRALAAGHGAILAGAHLGSVSLVGQILPARGYRITALLEPIEPPELFDLITARRQTFGARLLPAGPSAVRELLAALRRNEVVGLITDRDITGTGLPLEFFGARTTFPEGAAAIALRSGAPILPAVGVVQADGRFRAIIEPPLPVEPASGDRQHDVRQLTQAVARRLEYHIADHPEQWTVFQKRWPDAAPG
jgi:KDO2-lipid IV(A) lauroyltransferase